MDLLILLESSLGHRLLHRQGNISPISNDDKKNFYRWEFSERYPQFPSAPPFSQWKQKQYFELSNAIDAGDLKIVSSRPRHMNPQIYGQEYTQIGRPSQDGMHHPHSMTGERHNAPTNSSPIDPSKNQVSHWNVDSPNSSSVTGPSLGHDAQVPTSESIQRNKIHVNEEEGAQNSKINNAELLNLCNEAWISLENKHNTDDHEHNFARTMLNMGLVYAIQLKEQVQRANTLEHENVNLKIQILNLEHNQAKLQQQILNMRGNDKKEISNARLEGEKIAEKYVERLWNLAKEEGRVIGVCAVENKYKMQNHTSVLTARGHSGPSPGSSTSPNTGTGGRPVLGNLSRKVNLRYFIA
ncbi:hypothetical protein NHQ30_006185 [Ciborinia camelliae]|nr:hypothetical protein NHQ30_006185 [Ciborinia camelliae]